MQIDVFSFILGACFIGAVLIIADRLIPFFGGNKQVRELKKRVRELEASLKKKNAYISKAVDELKKEKQREVGGG